MTSRKVWVPLVLIVAALLLALGGLGFYLIRLLRARPSVILSGNTCAVPCWRGIVPGSTDEAGALESLLSMPEVDQGSIQKTSDGLRWEFKTGVNERTGSVNLARGHVQSISLDSRLPFSEMVDRFGTPTEYCGTLWAMETQGYQAVFFFPTPGAAVRVGETKFLYVRGYVPRLEAETLTDEVLLFDPQAEEAVLTQACGRGPEQAAQIRQRMHPWTGYGTLEGEMGP